MDRVKIIIVDSGVRIDHPKFSGTQIQGYGFKDYKKISDFQDEYGHGTAVYNIISKCTDFAEINNIKLYGLEQGVEEDALVSVLEYIYYNEEGVDLINLSLGITVSTQYTRLLDICNKLIEKGAIIIAAFDNSGAISYPAAFENVIGVIAGETCRKVTELEYIESLHVNIGAYGRIQKLAWNNPDYIMMGGNSFACAHVTVCVARILAENRDKKQIILSELEKTAIRKVSIEKNSRSENRRIQIKKAALFPFNKEMHSLIRYSELLPFEIVDVYDTKYTAQIGTYTDFLLQDNVKSIEIKNAKNIQWDKFDTLILGHLEELERVSGNSNIKSEIISQALSQGKQIYSFDNLKNFVTDNAVDLLWYPSVDVSDLPPFCMGKLHGISKPVLGVFGTSSRQGKFTLQLKLRKLFLQDGYNVGQIGTEPSSLLFGMDNVYPMGYNSSVYIKEFDVIRYLNECINELCLKEKDIILVGSQSGTVSYDVGNLEQFNIPQYNFLLGTQPDAVILCVNPYDDVKYISRTIQFLESSVNCEVLALVMFPMDLKDDWRGIYSAKVRLSNEKYEEIKKVLETEFGKPVYNLDRSNHIQTLYEQVINYFVDE